MLGGMSRRLFLGGAVSAFAGVAVGEAPLRSIRPAPRPGTAVAYSAPAVEELIAQARLGGEVGFVVANARTGQVLESHNPGLGLPPASITKAVTALYALDALGPDFRFQTSFVATGPVVDGVVQGDLLLRGSGDPMLDTDALSAMVVRLKAAGVTGVTGGFRIYAGALPYIRSIDPRQPDHVGYNPAISGTNLNFNRVYFQWQRGAAGWDVSMDARSETIRPAVTVARMAVVNRDMPTYTYTAAQGVDEWTVAAAALGNGGSRWLPVRRPDLYAGEVAQVIARAHGIRLPAPTVAEGGEDGVGGTVLVAHESASLATIVRLMLMHSTNLTAEVIGLTATAARGGDAGSLEASAKAMTDWMRTEAGAEAAHFVDHSGLSDLSRVSAADMVKLLVKVGPGSTLHGQLKEIVPLDVQGEPVADAAYRIHAKTGSLNFVSTLAGFVTGPDDAALAFVVLSGDVARRAEIEPDDMERPDGAWSWARRARWLQHQFIHRWSALYKGA